MKIQTPTIQKPNLADGGNILIVTMVTIAILSVLVGSAFQLTSQNARMTSRSDAMVQTQAMAEGAMEIMYAQWRYYINKVADLTSGKLPSRGEFRFIENNLPTNDPSMASAFVVDGVEYTIVRYRIVPLSLTGELLEADTDVPAEDTLDGATDGSIFGMERPPDKIYRYAAEVTVIREGTGINPTPISASVLRSFEVAWTSLTDNAIFYEHRMEIHPGAVMGIFGKVHGNERIYHTSGNLTFWDKVFAASSINNAFAPGDGTRGSTSGSTSNWGQSIPNPVNPANPTTSLQSTPHADQRNPDSLRKEVLGANPDTLFTDLSNPNHAGVGRELIEKPNSAFSDPIASLRLYNQADVRILVNSAVPINSPNRLSVYVKDYSNPDNPAAETLVPASDPLYSAIAATIVRGDAINANTGIATQHVPAGSAGQIIRDNREAASTHLTSFDVNKLTQLLGSAPADAIRTTLANEAVASTLPIAGVTSGTLSTSSSVVIGAQGHPTLPSGFNGIVYISDQSADAAFAANPSTNVAVKDKSPAVVVSPTTAAQVSMTGLEKGIRLVNGGVFSGALVTERNPEGGFTVATDNPVYVLGDYNTGRQVTGTTVSGAPTSNNGNDSTAASGSVPSVNDALAESNQGTDKYNDFTNSSGYERKPAMIAGDAFNVLSNSWSDANSTSNVSSRVPSHTTMNTAIVSGNVPSGTISANGTLNQEAAGLYSGGVENFPRFLENWTNSRHFTYFGSIIQLYRSKFANGRWGQSNVYAAPRRRWYYENKFRRTPPPGILASVEYSRGRSIHPGKSTYEVPPTWNSTSTGTGTGSGSSL